MKTRRSLFHVSIILLSLMLLVSCFSGTKEERQRARIEETYHRFHQYLLEGVLPEKMSGEMLVGHLDGPLLEEAARKYPYDSRGPIYFDTVHYTDNSGILFANTESEELPYGVVQEPDGRWWFIDDEYMSPLVTGETSRTKDMDHDFTIPENWTIFAESWDSTSRRGTHYFMNVPFETMVEHFDNAMDGNDSKEKDAVLGDMYYEFYDEKGDLSQYVTVWELFDGVTVLDTEEHWPV